MDVTLTLDELQAWDNWEMNEIIKTFLPKYKKKARKVPACRALKTVNRKKKTFHVFCRHRKFCVNFYGVCIIIFFSADHRATF